MREALKLALEALQKIYIAPEHEEYIRVWWPACEQAITAIKEALAQQDPVAKYSDIVSDGGLDPRNTTPPQPEQEAVTHVIGHGTNGDEVVVKLRSPLYAIPTHRKPLTEAQIVSVAYDCNALPEVITDQTLIAFVRAIEVIYGIKE